MSKGAHLRLAERQARELFGKIAPEIVPVENPLAAYAEFAGEVIAWKRLMHSLLEDLSTVEVTTQAQGEQTRAKVQLYERSMDRANTVLSAYARLNIDARLAAINEQQVQAVVGAIDAVIKFLGVDGQRAQQARAVGARHLSPVVA